MTFTGTIENHRVQWSDPDAVRAHVAGLEGKRVYIVIDERKPRRSDEQNRYMHGVVFKTISEHTGFELEEVKELCKAMFLAVEKGGYHFSRSTASLNTADMKEFIDRIIRWAAVELGIAIPEAR